MAILNINFTEAVPVPSNGYRVRYRIKGTLGAYTTLVVNPTSSPATITGLLPSTEYEGLISSDCGGSYSAEQPFNTCTCAVGYTPTFDNDSCEKEETIAPTIIYSGYCLAASTENAYAAYVTRVYNPGFSNATIVEIIPSIPSDVYAELTTPVLWVRTTPTNGPMNRAGVWIDSDCNTFKDSVTPGVIATIGAVFTNAGGVRTIYIGAAGDNSFNLKVNGINVATSPNNTSPLNFNIWHIFPVVVQPGDNLINLIATSGGGVDGVAMTIYDNTAAQIAAATTEGDLTIPFTTASLINTSIDVAYCDPTYTLDPSGGVGFYICKRTVTDTCNGI